MFNRIGLKKISLIPLMLIILHLAVLDVGAEGSKDSTENVPSWIRTYPSDKSYYVGIGGSNTGNLADDRNKAAAAARAELASQISVQVNSELKDFTQASTEGDFVQTIQRNINESVQQNLKSIETVDTWTSSSQGVWVYVRLSKAIWTNIIRKEIAGLTSRVVSILEPVTKANDNGMSQTEQVGVLSRAKNILIESPWVLRVADTLFGSNGVLLDSVNSEISKRFSAVSINSTVTPKRIKFGEDISINGTIKFNSPNEIGAYPLRVQLTDQNFHDIVTEPNGSFTATISTVDLIATSILRISLMPNLSGWGLLTDEYTVAESTNEISIDPILIGLSINSNSVDELNALNGAIGDLIVSFPIPINIVQPSKGDFELEYEWTVFDYPRIKSKLNTPYITKIGAVFTFKRKNTVLFVREIEAKKDGGFNWEQAHKRAAGKLLDQISNDKELIQELVGFFK